MDVAVQPLISRRHTKNLSPFDPRFNCTGKWRRITSSSSSSPNPNYFLKNCNGSWRRTSSPIPDCLNNYCDGTIMSQRRRRPSSLLKEANIVAKPSSACAKQLNGGFKILIKRGEDLPESLKKEMCKGVLETGSFMASHDSPSPSSLSVPSFVCDKKRVTFNMDDQALDLELMQFGFFAVAA